MVDEHADVETDHVFENDVDHVAQFRNLFPDFFHSLEFEGLVRIIGINIISYSLPDKLVFAFYVFIALERSHVGFQFTGETNEYLFSVETLFIIVFHCIFQIRIVRYE